MPFERDVAEKLRQDFGNEVPQAICLINKTLAQAEYLKHPRILRCIIFLAEGNLAKLESYSKVAAHDPGDVMLGRVYKQGTGKNWDQIHGSEILINLLAKQTFSNSPDKVG